MSNIERLHDTQLQQQIILALQRLREDMRSVMNRLEVVERLAATHTKSSALRPCLHCASNASQHQGERWWPFNVSGQAVLLFLLWPFVAQGLVYLLRKTHKRSQISSWRALMKILNHSHTVNHLSKKCELYNIEDWIKYKCMRRLCYSSKWKLGGKCVNLPSSWREIYVWQCFYTVFD